MHGSDQPALFSLEIPDTVPDTRWLMLFLMSANQGMLISHFEAPDGMQVFPSLTSLLDDSRESDALPV